MRCARINLHLLVDKGRRQFRPGFNKSSKLLRRSAENSSTERKGLDAALPGWRAKLLAKRLSSAILGGILPGKRREPKFNQAVTWHLIFSAARIRSNPLREGI